MVEWCIHLANIFYLLSFLGRDMLWLRILTCAGLIFGIVFFTCHALYGPIFWHFVFLGINLYQIHHLLRARREMQLSREQLATGEAVFRDLSHDELVDSLAHAVCSDSTRFEPVTRDGKVTLTREEQVLREIAFRRLSRAELLNLLTRRTWRAIKRLRPRWKRRPTRNAITNAS